jgi:hypothetical protein
MQSPQNLTPFSLVHPFCLLPFGSLGTFDANDRLQVGVCHHTFTSPPTVELGGGVEDVNEHNTDQEPPAQDSISWGFIPAQQGPLRRFRSVNVAPMMSTRSLPCPLNMHSPAVQAEANTVNRS